MRFITALADLTEADIPRAGGKAVQCGRLHDGDRIRLDATSGLVEILSRAGHVR